MAGDVAKTEEDWSAFEILTDKLTGKRPVERPRRKWEDNIISKKYFSVRRIGLFRLRIWIIGEPL